MSNCQTPHNHLSVHLLRSPIFLPLSKADNHGSMFSPQNKKQTNKNGHCAPFLIIMTLYLIFWICHKLTTSQIVLSHNWLFSHVTLELTFQKCHNCYFLTTTLFLLIVIIIKTICIVDFTLFVIFIFYNNISQIVTFYLKIILFLIVNLDLTFACFFLINLTIAYLFLVIMIYISILPVYLSQKVIHCDYFFFIFLTFACFIF